MKNRRRLSLKVCWLAVLLGVTVLGCQTVMNRVSQRLTNWRMLDQQEAMNDPIKAVGGDAILFVPGQESKPLSTRQLAEASPETLVSYYAPIFVQQRVDSQAQRFPYPPEYDMIGEAHLSREASGKLKSYVAGAPKTYAIYKKLLIEGHEHVQLTYTAWYPAHPRMKAIDVEEADIDSCVLRITLDAENTPLFYETIAACGCFHKVFVEDWIEESARQLFGGPEKDKKFCVERNVADAINWDVAGVVVEPRDQPRRPVVFLKAGDHRVIGVSSSARLSMPGADRQRLYELTSYADLYAVTVDSSRQQAPFFDMDNGGKVRGGQRRRERFLMSIVGVDDAGRPRADDQIKLHFDQSTWGDPTIYAKFLRLPPGTL